MPKRKRPSAAEDGAPVTKLQEVVRKMTLNQGLQRDGGVAFAKQVEEFVPHVSKLAHLGSLVCNAVLLRVVKGESAAHPIDWRKDSTFEHFFNVGTPSNRERPELNPLILDTWKEEFKPFHGKVVYIKGQSQVVKFASQQYMTNFHNSLWMNFNSRLNRLIINRIVDDKDDFDSKLLHTLRARIRNREVRQPVELDHDLKAFVKFVREELLAGLLEPDEVMWDDWAKDKIKTSAGIEGLVKFHAHVRAGLREFDKTFSLAPIHDVARRCVRIDKKMLFEMMKRAALFDGNEKQFNENADDHFERVFKWKRQPGLTFTNLVDTDGVSVIFHFKREARDIPVTKATKKKAKVEAERNPLDVGVDTGLVNQVFAVRENADRTFDRWVLRKSQYYASAGISQATHMGKVWCKEIAAEHEALKTVTAKSKSLEELRAYLAVVAKGYDRLWEVKLKKKWARSKLRVYGGKNRVMDGFFAGMAKDIGSDATVFWGDASVNPSMKGTKSAPTTRQLVRARLHLKRIVLVDEFRTSKVCHCCDKQIHAVRRRVVGEDGKKRTREVRGLRWCSTSRKFLDRDLNAAVNMLRCGTGRTENTTRGSKKAVSCGPQESKWIAK